MRKIIYLLVLASLNSCGSSRKIIIDQELFESSAVLHQFRSVADLNDAYFEIRENNFFEYYRQLFDSVKNSRYSGKYTMNGDTMMLDFVNKKGSRMLGSKAILSTDKKEITFFDQYPGIKKKLIVP